MKVNGKTNFVFYIYLVNGKITTKIETVFHIYSDLVRTTSGNFYFKQTLFPIKGNNILLAHSNILYYEKYINTKVKDKKLRQLFLVYLCLNKFSCIFDLKLKVFFSKCFLKKAKKLADIENYEPPRLSKYSKVDLNAVRVNEIYNKDSSIIVELFDNLINKLDKKDKSYFSSLNIIQQAKEKLISRHSSISINNFGMPLFTISNKYFENFSIDMEEYGPSFIKMDYTFRIKEKISDDYLLNVIRFLLEKKYRNLYSGLFSSPCIKKFEEDLYNSVFQIIKNNFRGILVNTINKLPITFYFDYEVNSPMYLQDYFNISKQDLIYKTEKKDLFFVSLPVDVRSVEIPKLYEIVDKNQYIFESLNMYPWMSFELFLCRYYILLLEDIKNDFYSSDISHKDIDYKLIKKKLNIYESLYNILVEKKDFDKHLERVGIEIFNLCQKKDFFTLYKSSWKFYKRQIKRIKKIVSYIFDDRYKEFAEKRNLCIQRWTFIVALLTLVATILIPTCCSVNKESKNIVVNNIYYMEMKE